MRPILVLLMVTGPAFAQPAAPKIIRLDHKGDRIAVAFSPDSKTLASGGQDNYIRFWNVATHKMEREIQAHNAPAGVSRLAYFPDGKTLASASWAGDGTVKIWDVATARQKGMVAKNDGGISVLCISLDGKFLAHDADKVRLHDLTTGRDAFFVTNRDAVDSAAFSPDSKLLATARGDGRVRFWNTATAKLVRAILAGQSTSTGSQALAFSPDGITLATAGRGLRLWNVATGKEITALVPGEAQFCVAISPDGRWLACGAMSGPLRLWSLVTLKETHVWDEIAVSLAFSPDNRWLAFGDRSRGGVGLVEIAAAKK